MTEIAGRTTPQVPDETAPRRAVPAWVVTVASVTFLLLLWQYFGRNINPVFGSYPSEIALAFVELAKSGKLMAALLESIQPFFAGYGLAILIGVPLGLLIGRFRVMEAALGIYVTAGYAMPLVALLVTRLSVTTMLTATPALAAPYPRMPVALFTRRTRLIETLAEAVAVGLITIPPLDACPAFPLSVI